MTRLALACLVCVALFPSLLAAQSDPANRMTPELLWKLRRVSSPAVSPDGTLIAWKEQQFDLAANSSTSDILVKDWRTGEEFVVAKGWKSAGELQWTANDAGATLWFAGQETAESPAAPQVFSIASTQIGAGKPAQVSNVELGVSNLKVAPDGKGLAFTCDIKLDQTVTELYSDLPLADARIIDSLMYRHWNAWHDFSFSHLHVAWVGEDGKMGDATDLMAGQRNDCPVQPFGGAEQIAWSPDSKWIAYTTKISDRPAESTDSSVWIVDPKDPSTARDISAGRPGYDNNPVWRPDGAAVAFNSMVRPGFEADRNRVMEFVIADGSLSELTAGLDQNANSTAYTADSSGIWFASEQQGAEQLFLLPRGGQARQLTSGDFNWTPVSLLPDGERAVVMRQSMLRPDEVFLLNLGDGSATPISHANDETYASLELPSVVSRQVMATDGKMIHCWVVLPPGFDPASGQKWPLLLFCQGGPQSQVSQAFSYRWNFHLMGANGYVVIAPNRRGLPGFGQAWNDQISGDWGGQAMRDLLSATDHISQEPWIDTARRAAVGASFGGYSVYWLMGRHEDRFAAMIAHCGVYNLESMYGSTEELFFVNWDLGGPFWRSGEIANRYLNFSPHKFAQNWETPLLVIHGEKDFRVPVNQGMEAFTAAQVQNVPSRFLYFPEEGHWVMKPQNSVLWQRVFFDWLATHCGPK